MLLSTNLLYNYTNIALWVIHYLSLYYLLYFKITILVATLCYFVTYVTNTTYVLISDSSSDKLLETILSVLHFLKTNNEFEV